MDKGEQLARVWRSKRAVTVVYRYRPSGQRGQRAGVVQRCMKGYRLPEPTRWADAVASERPAFVRYTANQP